MADVALIAWGTSDLSRRQRSQGTTGQSRWSSSSWGACPCILRAAWRRSL